MVLAAGDDVVVFLRVGRYVELYGPPRLLAERVLGLRSIRLPRFGWALAAGLPAWRAAEFALRALRAGLGVLWLADHRQTRAPVLLLPAAKAARRARIKAMSTVVYGGFEWDDTKALGNLAKHGVSFEEASTVFADPCYILRVDDAHPDTFFAIGVSGLARVLTVVHVERGPHLRLVSARRATAREAAIYERRRF